VSGVTRPIVVLGGYGRIGRLCVQELVARTRAPIKIAGRNAQRAESLALSFERRASASYTDASVPRVLARTIEGAAAVVACSGGDLGAALQCALELRVPFVGLSPIPLGERGGAHVAELAWKAQVPIVLHAGALPGIPGLLAESLVRRVAVIRRLEIAASGPFVDTDTARRDQSAARAALSAEGAARQLPELFAFDPPVGRRALVPAACADLSGFAASHLVETLRYLEPPEGLVARLLSRALRASGGTGFAVVARAFGEENEPEAVVSVSASDVLAPAAAIASAVAVAMLEGQVPAGLCQVREAISPALALGELEKRGVRVRVGARS
jgi:hypothetical protein